MPARSAPPGFRRSIAPTRIRLRTCRTPGDGRWRGWCCSPTAGGAAVVHAPLARPLLGLATATLLATLVKCALYGRHSDVSRLPPIGAHSRATSVLAYRLAIAWLHFVQPFARLLGTGAGRHQAAQGSPASARASAPACRPAWGQRRSAMRFGCCCRLPVETSFWSQRWIDVADFLRSTANRLRQQRAVRQIELDSGWWEDRDLTITNRTWFRLDVRALVEDHGGGQCLHRVAVRSRLTAAAALPLLVAAAAAVALRYAGCVLAGQHDDRRHAHARRRRRPACSPHRGVVLKAAGRRGRSVRHDGHSVCASRRIGAAAGRRTRRFSQQGWR